MNSGYHKEQTTPQHVCAKCESSLKSALERCTCGYSRVDEVKHSCAKCGKPLNNLNKRCSCGYSRIDDVKYKCVKCGDTLTNVNKRCACGYSRADDRKYACVKCGRELNNSHERCSCGYSRADDNQHKCKRCGELIEGGAASGCPSCGITCAGFENWPKYNPIYRIVFRGDVLFEGYKHLCIDFMTNNLICPPCTSRKLFNHEGGVFLPKYYSQKYPNSLKYSGLRSEFISYPRK